jgi:thiamine-phosphate pyrophosphorylase
MKERDMRLDKKLLLYAVTDRKWLEDRTLAADVEEALKGGVTFVQLREKNLGEEEFYREALEIKELCKKYNCLFVVNDNVDIAIKADADGVHVGQDDMAANDVRTLIGENKILGVSAQTVEQAVKAEKMGADYLGVGAVFPTDSKDDAVEVDYATLKEICESVNIPVIAIGGITRENVCELSDSKIVGIAVISAIFGKKNIRRETQMLKKTVEEILGGKR